MAEQKFEINKIYTKDISSEAPNNPEIFKINWEPNINLNLANAINTLPEEDSFEVVIKLTVTAKIGEQTAYIIEVEQAGIFTVSGFEEAQKNFMLGAMAPNILFPYARELISSLSQKSGFPPILLNPISFESLYQQHMENQAKQQAGEEDGEVKH